MPATRELAVRSFATAASWELWLAENFASRDGLWLKIAKKASGVASVTYEEALDAALCHGWIDGQVKPRNIEHVTRLKAAGRMKPPGLAEVEAAVADGRWTAAYDSPKNMEVPDDFLVALGKKKKALRFFQTLNRTDTYAIAWRLKTARKPETRQRRFDALLAMLAREEKLH